MSEYGLGRRPAKDDLHLRGYSLAADATPDTPTPVVLGVNWYEAFGKPRQPGDGTAWLPTSGLGAVRGGHAVCLKPPALTDPAGAYAHYNQLREGACVGMAWARASSLVDRRLFDGFRLYGRAKEVDAFAGTDYDGTEVRAGGAVARTEGQWLVRAGKTAATPGARWRIGAYFWATSVEQILACLHADPNLGYVEFLNSWGTHFPHVTRIPLDLLDRLVFREDGEAAVAVNAPRVVGIGGGGVPAVGPARRWPTA